MCLLFAKLLLPMPPTPAPRLVVLLLSCLSPTRLCALGSRPESPSFLRRPHRPPALGAMLGPTAPTGPRAAAHRRDDAAEAAAFSNAASAAVVLSDAHVPLPSGGTALLSCLRSVRDVDGDATRRFLCSVPFDVGGTGRAPPPPPLAELHASERARYMSPSGEKVAVLREESVRGGAGTRQVVEIWTESCQRLYRRLVLPAELHGKVCHDPGWFGRAVWNPQETALCYSAERSPLKTRSFFAADAAGDGGPPAVAGGQHTWGVGKEERWGERYADMSPLLDLYCLSVATGRVGRLGNVPGGGEGTRRTLGQPVFAPCGTHVAYTAWNAGAGPGDARRLGMTYCFQRPCALHVSPVRALLDALGREEDGEAAAGEDGPAVPLTAGARLARSPRFSAPRRDGAPAQLAFLRNEAGFDTHGGSMALCTLDWDAFRAADGGAGVVASLTRELVGVVDAPSSVGGFPGLFLNQLPPACFTRDNRHVLLTTQWGSVGRVVRVSVADGTLRPLHVTVRGGTGAAFREPADATSRGSQALLCLTGDGGALVSESAPHRPDAVAYLPPAQLLADDGGASGALSVDASALPAFRPVAASSCAPNGDLPDFSYRVLSLDPTHVEGATGDPVDSILLLPTGDGGDPGAGAPGKPPLLVVPHGGPHSCHPTAYIPSYAYLCAAGYAVLFVNYRGSTGFGQAPLECLAGRIGVVDVADVVAATEAVRASGDVDAARVGICGGSHGGFLAGHLAGRFPHLYKVAAMRNPVTNIASMVTATDIPDWCYVESFGSGYHGWETSRGPTREELDAMWRASPIAHIDGVVAPTLIALGLQDRRVPPSQGMEYYYALRSQGVPTKLLTYEHDNHAIDRVASEADHWINCKKWFDEHL